MFLERKISTFCVLGSLASRAGMESGKGEILNVENFLLSSISGPMLRTFLSHTVIDGLIATIPYLARTHYLTLRSAVLRSDRTLFL